MCFGGVRLNRADHATGPDIKVSASIRRGAAELITPVGAGPALGLALAREGGLLDLLETLELDQPLGRPIKVQSQSVPLNTVPRQTKEMSPSH